MLLVELAPARDLSRFRADADEVEAIYENGLVLTLPYAECQDLPKPSANPAVMRDDPAESRAEVHHEKLRRAWDRISGKY